MGFKLSIMNNIKKFALLIILIVIFGCNGGNNIITNKSVYGDWAYLTHDSTYGEIYFSTSRITFYTENDGQFGPFNYKIQNDSLVFNDVKYKIINHNCNKIILKNAQAILELDKLNLNQVIENDSLINPFFLRRCNYLVNKGIITMKDAVDYLSSIVTTDKIEEVKIPVN